MTYAFAAKQAIEQEDPDNENPWVGPDIPPNPDPDDDDGNWIYTLNATEVYPYCPAQVQATAMNTTTPSAHKSSFPVLKGKFGSGASMQWYTTSKSRSGNTQTSHVVVTSIAPNENQCEFYMGSKKSKAVAAYNVGTMTPALPASVNVGEQGATFPFTITYSQNTTVAQSIANYGIIVEWFAYMNETWVRYNGVTVNAMSTWQNGVHTGTANLPAGLIAEKLCLQVTYAGQVTYAIMDLVVGAVYRTEWSYAYAHELGRDPWLHLYYKPYNRVDFNDISFKFFLKDEPEGQPYEIDITDYATLPDISDINNWAIQGDEFGYKHYLQWNSQLLNGGDEILVVMYDNGVQKAFAKITYLTEVLCSITTAKTSRSKGISYDEPLVITNTLPHLMPFKDAQTAAYSIGTVGVETVPAGGAMTLASLNFTKDPPTSSAFWNLSNGDLEYKYESTFVIREDVLYDGTFKITYDINQAYGGADAYVTINMVEERFDYLVWKATNERADALGTSAKVFNIPIETYTAEETRARILQYLAPTAQGAMLFVKPTVDTKPDIQLQTVNNAILDEMLPAVTGNESTWFWSAYQVVARLNFVRANYTYTRKFTEVRFTQFVSTGGKEAAYDSLRTFINDTMLPNSESEEQWSFIPRNTSVVAFGSCYKVENLDNAVAGYAAATTIDVTNPQEFITGASGNTYMCILNVVTAPGYYIPGDANPHYPSTVDFNAHSDNWNEYDFTGKTEHPYIYYSDPDFPEYAVEKVYDTQMFGSDTFEIAKNAAKLPVRGTDEAPPYGVCGYAMMIKGAVGEIPFQYTIPTPI